jgi:predicted nuclease of predicted toxin-antitoxin system
MKILLDECITKHLKKYLHEYQVYTVRELNLSGLKNVVLITYCIENGLNVLLIIDKSLIFQQNLDKYSISIVVLNS